MDTERFLSILPVPPKTNDNKCSSKLNSCKICGDEAFIINYGALSCQSCKTFFRRNGFSPEIVHSCRYNGQCEVNMLTRRICTACRLRKCFSVGMSTKCIRKEICYTKKSSLLTGPDRSQALKYKTIKAVSQLPTLDLLQNDRSSLTASQWKLFSNVLHAYDTFSLISTFHRILKTLSSSPGEIHLDAPDALETVRSVYRSMQSFVNSTPDFQVLSVNEQQSLFERNLRGISTCCANILFRDTDFFDNPECCSGFIKVYGLEMIKEVKHFNSQLDPDPILLKLMLIVIAFSSNTYIVDVHENMHHDSFVFGTFRLFGSQNVYVELLWKYMVYRYGHRETVIRFDRLVKFVVEKIKRAASIYMSNNIHHHFVDDVVQKTKEKLIISQNQPIPLWGKT